MVEGLTKKGDNAKDDQTACEWIDDFVSLDDHPGRKLSVWESETTIQHSRLL